MRIFGKRVNGIVCIALIVVLVVGVCALIGNFTKGFTDWSFDRDRNEANLLKLDYKDKISGNLGNGITVTYNEDGTITLDGTSTANEAVVIEIETIALNSGNYILTGVEGANTAGVYLNARAVGDSIAWYGDMISSNANGGGGRTHTVATDGTTYTIEIVVMPKTEMKNMTIRPVLAAGTEVVDFFA
jgi:hypothetical protein